MKSAWRYVGAAALVVAGLAGCEGCPMTQPSLNLQPAPGTDHCAAACKHIGPKDAGGLGCSEGEPGTLPDGGTFTCEDYCVNAQNNGHVQVWLNPVCVESVDSCGKIESCVSGGK